MYKQGLATLEILIAFAVFILSITAIIVIAFGNQSVIVDSELHQQAIYKAGRTLELARAQARANFLAVDDVAPVIEDSLFSLALDVSDLTPCLKLASSRVGWQTESRGQHSVLTSLLASPEEFLNLGSNCDTTPLAGDWDNPTSLASIDTTPAGARATDIDVITVGGQRLVLLTADFSGPGDDLWIIDATDERNPTVTASLDLGDYAANAVFATESHAYVAYATSSKQVSIVNISNPMNPVEVAQISMALPDLAPHGMSVYFYNDLLYVGLPYQGVSSADEFRVYNVSNPYSPQFLGSYDVNHNVHDIIVRGDITYLATSDTLGNYGELAILDVSNPASISTLDTFNGPGTAPGFRLALSGTSVYLGRKRSVNLPDLFVLNVSDPTNIVPTDSENLGLANNTAVVGIAIRGNLAFVATSDQTDPFQIWDISDHNDIRRKNTCNLNFSEKTTGLDFADNLGFLSNESNDALRVIYDKTTC